MPTKTFAGRTDEKNLAYINAVTQAQFGLSYGQYCSSVLIDAVKQGAELPRPGTSDAASRRKAAIAKMKRLSQAPKNKEIGLMSDDAIKDLIASRYES